jgi:CBS domain-containing protein
VQIREIMRRDVGVVRPLDTVQQAAAKMVEHNLGSAPVCEHGRLIGLIVDRDIVVRLAALGRDPSKTRVRDVMTPDPFYCFEYESERHIAEEMAHLEVSQLPVLDRRGRVVGMAALEDLTAAADAA